MNKIHLFLLLLVIALGSCSSDSFKIDGDITNLDGNTVKVVFRGDSGAVETLAEVDKKGHFTFEGTSAEPVIVSLFNYRNEPLAMVVASNGDHLKVKGDADKAMAVKVKGNSLNEDWQLFRDEHAAFYGDPNPSRLDAAIEKYVREHPAEMLSTVLLIADYSDYSDNAKIQKMLNGIEAKARPESLIKSLPAFQKGDSHSRLPRLMTLNLWKQDGDFEEIKLTDRTTLLSFWAFPQKDRAALTAKVKAISDEAGEKLRVIDILTESDTIRWHQTIAGESWPHYWAPAGPLEQGVQLLGITSLPWYAVTDSTGLVVYSGPSIDQAHKKANDITH